MIVHLTEHAAKGRSDNEGSLTHTVQSREIGVSLLHGNDIGNHTTIRGNGEELRLHKDKRPCKETGETTPNDQ